MFPIIFPALGTGLRRGEVLGLRWSDLDLERRTLTVAQSLEQTEEGLRFKAPKTKGSRRTIALSPSLAEELQGHRAARIVGRAKIRSVSFHGLWHTRSRTAACRRSSQDRIGTSWSCVDRDQDGYVQPRNRRLAGRRCPAYRRRAPEGAPWRVGWQAGGKRPPSKPTYRSN